ncbi:hypothetical protein M3Y97_00543600 [Aphelenchoides bicaudatus]|nr:hypothetical protein M3Y97_00543600 [Aphelenchoides bicaudatus]
MATELTSAFNTLPSLPQVLSHYGPTAINGLIIVSTISGQSLINKLTFTCPCSYPLNEYHSLGFLFGPCIVLFMFAVLINQKTWRLVQGCCYRTRSTSHPLSTSLLYWLQILAQSLIAPVAWLFVSLLDGSYYKCLMAGNYCQNVPECLTSPAKLGICEMCLCNLDKVIGDKLISESQFYAWTLLISTSIVASIVMCCVRVFSRFTYSQNNYVQLYRDIEEKVFDEFAKENATNLAKLNSKRFFDSKQLFKIDWDQIASLPVVENPYVILSQISGFSKTAPAATSDQNWNYTTLQKWTSEKTADADDQRTTAVDIN